LLHSPKYLKSDFEIALAAAAHSRHVDSQKPSSKLSTQKRLAEMWANSLVDSPPKRQQKSPSHHSIHPFSIMTQDLADHSVRGFS
jgi:hypothetical protein